MNKFRNITIFLFSIVFALTPYQQVFAQEAKEPIVIVPGIMGSWNWEVMLQRNGSGSWDFFPSDKTWDNMIDALEKAGYEKDKTLFIAFYDWRQSNINSATDYLMPTIDKALANSPTGKVNIIAHSMGGLVTRRYIQSHNYRNDVNKLILLGTPNWGSSEVYVLWEGGVVPENWDKLTRAGVGLYLWYMTAATAQTADSYDTIHSFIPSIGELLPLYNFLKDENGELISYENLQQGRNYFLENLNLNSSTMQLQNVGGILTVAGKGQGTIESIAVVPRSASETKLWVDGVPEPITPIRDTTEGDNRVLALSASFGGIDIFPPVLMQNFWQRLFAKILPTAYAQLNPSEFLKHIEVDSKHGDLPTKAISDIFSTLSLPQPSVAYVPPPEPDNLTSFWFASPVEVKITDPQGRVITKNTNSIPGAIYTGESNPEGLKMIIIPNGLAGDYKVELVGTSDGKYHMAVALSDSDTDKIETVKKDIVEGEKVEYEVVVDYIASEPTAEIGEPKITLPESDVEEITLETLIRDINKSFDLGWIKDKKVRDSLIKQVNGAIKFNKKIEVVKEKLPDGSVKLKRVEVFDKKVNKILVKLFMTESQLLLKKKAITIEAYDLIKYDIEYLTK